MCEKAARIAELEREIVTAEDHARACLSEHRYVFDGRAQHLRGELARLRNEGENEAIPSGVYYNDGNFYSVAERKGMGWDFFNKWQSRRSEFPPSPALTQGEGSEPVGWKLVPVELTYDMRVAAVNTGLPGIGEGPPYEKMWRNMLAAAPASPPPLPAGNAKEATRYAEQLAVSLAARWYPEVTQWKPLRGDLIGLLTQIDNMTAGAERSQSDAAGNADPRVREALGQIIRESIRTMCREQNGWLDDAEGPIETDAKIHADKIAEEILSAFSALPSPQSQGLVEAAEERERLAKMIEEYCWERKPGAERVVLAIAANDVRRGRRLTGAEQIENLAKAIDPEDKELAARIRSRASGRSA